jgi:hypothetical protein
MFPRLFKGNKRSNNKKVSVDNHDGAEGVAAPWEKMFDLIKKDKWEKVRKLLKGPTSTQLCTGTDSTGLSVLSMALGSGAPIDVVLLMLAARPSASLEPDEYGAIPLHIACLNGASSSIIKMLIDHDNRASVTIADADERVPLHHAVEFSARLDDSMIHDQSRSSRSTGIEETLETGSTSSFEEDLETIRVLCDVAPDMVHHQNRNNDTPMDVAHVIKAMANTEKKKARIDFVYEILTRASRSVYQKKKKMWEEDGFIKDPNLLVEDAEMEMPSMASSLATSTIASRSTMGWSRSEFSESNRKL